MTGENPPSAMTAGEALPLDQKDFYRFLRDSLFEKGRMALATIIARSGSGPREPGAAMMVDTEGKTTGSVGGGLLESRVAALAKEGLQNRFSAVYSFSLTGEEAANSGMICGGRMEVLIEILEREHSACLMFLDRIISLEGGSPPVLIRSLRAEAVETASHANDASPSPREDCESLPETVVPVRTGWGVIAGGAFLSGSLDIGNGAAESLQNANVAVATLLEIESIRYFLLPVTSPITVWIIGAGHVGRALARLCDVVGLRTVVLDDRSDFADQKHFPASSHIRLFPALENCLQGLALAESDYIVIVTRGHAQDRSVLTQALHCGAGYIGMIGSRTKRDAIYEHLIDNGFTTNDLSRVCCPIGLDIGARTPAEIAVSIVAEMIAVQAGKITDIRNDFRLMDVKGETTNHR